MPSNSNLDKRSDRLRAFLREIQCQRIELTKSQFSHDFSCKANDGTKFGVMLHKPNLNSHLASWRYLTDYNHLQGYEDDLMLWLEQFRPAPDSNVLHFTAPGA